MSFRAKLVASFSALSAAVLLGSLWSLSRLETRRAHEEVRASLTRAAETFGELLRQRERQLTTNLKLLSGDFAFKQAVATGEPGTILSAAENHRKRIGSDLLVVTDADGKVFADTSKRFRPGHSLAKLPVVEAALGEEAAAGVEPVEGRALQFAAVPMSAPDLIGTVLAGFEIDDALAASLKKLTDSEIVFASEGRVVASTLAGPAREALAGALARLAEGEAKIHALGSENYLVLVSPVTPAVRAVVLRSWDRALEPLRQARLKLLLVGLAGIAATVLFGVFIASGVTVSLRELARATVELAKGNYDLKVNVRSRDEVGRLGEAFMTMAKGMAEREKIKSVLSKAVSKEIAEALLAQGKIELGGEDRVATVLFSDIRSFTTLSESLTPQQLVSQLNDYFGYMAGAIEAHKGVIDKYVGDAIMALFGAPLQSPQDAANALRAALAMIAALDEFNAARQAKGLAPLENGIGLNTGTLVAGNLGSPDRFSYTVIGDAVNLASRLEGLTKRYGVRLLVSEDTKKAAGDGFHYRFIDRVVVKGRHEALSVYEARAERPAWFADYEKGLEAVKAKDWPGAEGHFRAVLAARPGDKPSERFLERLAARGEGGGIDLEAATKMTEK